MITLSLDKLSATLEHRKPVQSHAYERVGRVASHLEMMGLAKVDVKLAGSVASKTDVGTSDVDLQVRFHSGGQQSNTLTYAHWKNMHSQVLEGVQSEYPSALVTEAAKCIRIEDPAHSTLIDVVPCFVDETAALSPVVFFAQQGIAPQRVATHTDRHIANTEQKDTATRGAYRQAVRIMKLARNALVGTQAMESGDMPSYFLECIVYSLPDAVFQKSAVDGAVKASLELLTQPEQLASIHTVSGSDYIIGSKLWHLPSENAMRAAEAFRHISVS